MMWRVASLFQYYQKRVFEENELWEDLENSQNTSIKANSCTNFNYFFLALRAKENSSKDVSLTYFHNMPL